MPGVLKLNYKGFVALRNSPGVIAELERRAKAIADAAGDGFEARPADTDMRYPKGRARVAVVATTAEAMLAEMNDHVLESAIDAGRS